MRFSEDFSGARNDQHLVELWLAGRPDTTRGVYGQTLEQFLKFLEARQIGLREVKVADVIDWSEALTGAPATQARHISSLKSLLTFAHRTGYTVFNVGLAIRCPKLPDLVHERIVDEETIQDVIRHTKTPRDRALVLVLYYSGARISEVCGLRFCDLRGTNLTLVHTKGSKVRTVLIPKFVVDALQKLRRPEDQGTTHIFRSRRNKPVSKGTAWFIVKQITEGAAVEMSPHWFRHAHASHTLDAGAPIHLVSRTLGHANIATTSRYLHVKPDQGSSQFLRQLE
jgi:integrase/recombinase XerD